jgi:ATP-dependent Lon protease
MVETRSQKRKLEDDVDILIDKDITNSNINCKIKKKKLSPPTLSESGSENGSESYGESGESSESEAVMTNEADDTDTDTVTLGSVDTIQTVDQQDEDDEDDNDFIDDDEADIDAGVDEETKLERKILNMKFNPKQTQEIMKETIKMLIKRYAREGKEFLKSDNENEYEQFNDLVDSIYAGEFFERVPLEDRKKKLKESMSTDEIKNLTEQLQEIKSQYNNNSPSIIDILRMNVSIEQKQKLLEKVHCLVNSEVLTPEYNSNLKFLTSNISSENDPELVKLEEQILKSSLNNGFADSYRTKILKSKMSFENKVIAYKKLEIMETYEETDTSEYAKYKAWMDTLLSVPFGVYNDSGITSESSIEDIQKYIKHVRDTLDRKLSFLEKPKDQIINIVTQMIRNPDVNINAIGLHGPAGVGKTSVVASIAESLGRPYATISLGGESDASSLTGHGFTYVGSGSGRLIDILRHTKTMNPIVLIDELDKVSETQHGKEIIGTLIHLTDSTTNSKYNYDKYFSGIEFDLSKVLFVFTYNDPSKVDRILADRLFKIKVDNYNFKEKMEITTKHIIPYMIDKFKFNTGDITFSEEAIKYLVNSSNKADGMRDVKTKIKIILSRINTLLLTNEEDNIVNLKYKKLYTYYKTLPVVIPEKHIDTFLDESITTEKGDEPPPHMYI